MKPPISLDAYGDVLTLDEAAAVLRIGRRAVSEAILTGQLPALRFGRRVVVPREALRKVLAGEAWSLPESVGDRAAQVAR